MKSKLYNSLIYIGLITDIEYRLVHNLSNDVWTYYFTHPVSGALINPQKDFTNEIETVNAIEEYETEFGYIINAHVKNKAIV